MMERFSVGEVAIIVVSEYDPSLLNTECTILAGPHACPYGRPGDSYTISTIRGSNWTCLAAALRKKRPPRGPQIVVRWADCPWQPERVRA